MFCEIRQKIFTLNDPKVFVKKFTPYDILKKAKETENKLDGITAVYIHPDNKYWSFFGEIYHFKPSLYLMSAGKIPLIFGAHYKDTGVSIGNETIYGYSIATAHKNQGTLRDLEDIGDNKKICKIANSVRIDNIIIFDYLNNVKDIIICNN